MKIISYLNIEGNMYEYQDNKENKELIKKKNLNKYFNKINLRLFK